MERARARATGWFVPAAVAVLALAVSIWLGLQGHDWADWGIEARPSVNALLAGHLAAFFQLAPPYGGSLLLRSPFMAAVHLCGGGAVAVYRAGALPCLAAAAALGLWLAGQLRRRGCGALAQAATVAACIASPIGVIALQQGHPEELLGAVLCVAAVLCAQRDRPLWSGLLLGLAIANKEWGILAVGPVLVALPRARVRTVAAAAVTAGAIMAPFVLVSSGGFVGQTEGVALHSDNIFGPLQLWWFFGTPAAHGARIGPGWLAGLGHTLPVAIMPPLALAHVVRAWRYPARRRGDAMLLLALLLLLRCALDPWDVVYYPLPCLIAVLAWDATSFDRPPIIGMMAALVGWFVFDGSMEMVGYRPDLLATLFTVVTVAAISAIGRRLYGGFTASIAQPGRSRSGPRDADGPLGDAAKASA